MAPLPPNPAPAALPTIERATRMIWVPFLLFFLIISALVILLMEMRSVQKFAQDFVKSHTRIAQLEDRLSTTVRVAAATQDFSLRNEYLSIEQEVGEALREADHAARALGMPNYLDLRAAAQDADSVGNSLAQLESKVFTLLLADDVATAKTITQGMAYSDLREQYAHAGTTLDARVDKLVNQQLTLRYSAVLGLFLTLALGALLTARIVVNRIRRQRDQILSLVQSTNLARDDAEMASRAKGAFLATMSHEIRTPLTAIVGFSDILLDPASMKDDRIGAATTIRRNAGHLLAIINDILDMSKIEAGRLDIEAIPCSPIQILQDVELMLSGKAQENQLILRCWSANALPTRIHTDPTRLKQALMNLIGNAIKFTKSGSVRVIAACDANGQRLTFRIEDDGIGMSREQINRLFNPFTQADNSMTRRFGGTGLGLFITKNITERLGGSLALESIPSKGSVFTLTIPTGSLEGVEWSYLEKRESPFETLIPALAPTSTTQNPTTSATAIAQTTTPATTQAPAMLSGTVLLVEDGIDNQRLITLILKKNGATVEVAENGEVGLHKALEAWRANKPFDLILMDMQMPVMDGYTAAGELRNQQYPRQIVALTAHALKGEQQQCIDAGCDFCLTKPIEKPVFLKEVAARMAQASQWSPTIPERDNRDDDINSVARAA